MFLLDCVVTLLFYLRIEFNLLSFWSAIIDPKESTLWSNCSTLLCIVLSFFYFHFLWTYGFYWLILMSLPPIVHKFTNFDYIFLYVFLALFAAPIPNITAKSAPICPFFAHILLKIPQYKLKLMVLRCFLFHVKHN